MINIEDTPIFEANLVSNHIIGALKEEQNNGMEQVFKIIIQEMSLKED